MVVDDVITAGTAIRESVDIIKKAGATLCGVLIALDRQEIGVDGTGRSAIQQVEEDFNIKVVCIVGLGHIIEYLEEVGGYADQLESVKEYRRQYGIKQ